MRLLWRGRPYELRLAGHRLTVVDPGGAARTVEIEYDGDVIRTHDGSVRFRAVRDRGGVWVWLPGRIEYLEYAKSESVALSGRDEIRSPMTGRVVALAVKSGDVVQAGQVLAVVAAMKMEFRIEAPHDGTVQQVRCREGDLVELGHVMVELR